VAGHTSKLADRSTPMVMIGYEAGTKAYRAYNPVHKKLVVTRDVIFEEEKSWNWSSAEPIEPISNEIFTVVYSDSHADDQGIRSDVDENTEDAPSPSTHTVTSASNAGSRSVGSRGPRPETSAPGGSVKGSSRGTRARGGNSSHGSPDTSESAPGRSNGSLASMPSWPEGATHSSPAASAARAGSHVLDRGRTDGPGAAPLGRARREAGGPAGSSRSPSPGRAY
jgi:hypothetical protein